jgi:hypothetical protein
MANRADERKFHYIYKITRADGSGKYYIGMHSTDDLEDGYFGSGQRLWHSIRKHGKDKHEKEILEFLPSRKELKAREKQLVNEEILDDPLCMNLQLGGEGGKVNIENFYSIIGKKSAALLTFEDRVKRSKTRMDTQIRNGTLGQSFTGKCHSQLAKNKISAAMQIKQMGSTNSQFGTCWVTNGKPIKIKKDLLGEYLMNGYSRGRKLNVLMRAMA